jgi:hypothetical protein
MALDGTRYRYAMFHEDETIVARWSNPDGGDERNRQAEIVRAFRSVFDW